MEDSVSKLRQQVEELMAQIDWLKKELQADYYEPEQLYAEYPEYLEYPDYTEE